MQPVGGIAIGAALQSPLQPPKGSADQAVQRHTLAALQPHHQSETLLALRHLGGLQQLGAVLADHRLRQLMTALLVPGQALLNRGIEPPADPLHRHRQQQRLGDGEAKGTARVTGLEDHRVAHRDRRQQLLLDHRLHVRPAPEDAAIAIELPADRAAADVAHLLLTLPLQVAGEDARGRALAAAGCTNHQMEAQRRL